MATPKKIEPDRVAYKARAGYLHCRACDRTVPFHGGPEPINEPWPMHRCKGAVRGFDEWTVLRAVDTLPAPPPE